jgi:hypothetical protein
MAKPIKSDSTLTPELVKIIKVFGLVSIALVIFFSFFNDRRANNTGQDETFRMSSSARMYFSNVRGISYDREVRRDAGMQIFRNKTFSNEDEDPNLGLILILNPGKDEAYIYLEPINLDWPITLRLKSANGQESFSFENGNKSDHFRYFEILKPAIESSELIEVQTAKGWIPIWTSPKEKEAIKAILEDYKNLTQ